MSTIEGVQETIKVIETISKLVDGDKDVKLDGVPLRGFVIITLGELPDGARIGAACAGVSKIEALMLMESARGALVERILRELLEGDKDE